MVVLRVRKYPILVEIISCHHINPYKANHLADIAILKEIVSKSACEKGGKLTKITPKLQNTKKSKTLDGFFTFLAQSSPIYVYF